MSCVLTCRQLLRLPPFPLARLEAAFLDLAVAGQSQPSAFQCESQPAALCWLLVLRITCTARQMTRFCTELEDRLNTLAGQEP